MSRPALAILSVLVACGGASGKPKEPTDGPGSGPGPAAAGAGPPAATWLVTEPKQAGNPWDGATGTTELVGYPIPELESVDAWATSQGAAPLAIGLLWPSEPMAVCASLSCPRGDRLLVLVAADAADKLAGAGFAPVAAGRLHALAAPGCDSPWHATSDEGPQDEAVRAVKWAGENGGDPAWLGFLYPHAHGEPPVGCPTPRFDWLVIESKSPAGADKLAALGFSANP